MNDKSWLENTRKSWALQTNRKLEEANIDEQIDHRRLDVQGMEQIEKYNEAIENNKIMEAYEAQQQIELLNREPKNREKFGSKKQRNPLNKFKDFQKEAEKIITHWKKNYSELFEGAVEASKVALRTCRMVAEYQPEIDFVKKAMEQAKVYFSKSNQDNPINQKRFIPQQQQEEPKIRRRIL